MIDSATRWSCDDSKPPCYYWNLTFGCDIHDPFCNKNVPSPYMTHISLFSKAPRRKAPGHAGAVEVGRPHQFLDPWYGDNIFWTKLVLNCRTGKE